MNIANLKKRIEKLDANPVDTEPLDIFFQIVKPGPKGPIKVGSPILYSDVENEVR